MSILGRIKDMFIPKTILSEIPASVANREEAIEEWFDAYKMKAPWLDYTYRTVDGRTKNRKRLSLNAGKLVCKELSSLHTNLPAFNDRRLRSFVLPSTVRYV